MRKITNFPPSKVAIKEMIQSYDVLSQNKAKVTKVKDKIRAR